MCQSWGRQSWQLVFGLCDPQAKCTWTPEPGVMQQPWEFALSCLLCFFLSSLFHSLVLRIESSYVYIHIFMLWCGILWLHICLCKVLPLQVGCARWLLLLLGQPLQSLTSLRREPQWSFLPSYSLHSSRGWTVSPIWMPPVFSTCESHVSCVLTDRIFHPWELLMY